MSKCKKIVIKNCRTCPRNDHRGGFGQVSYVPFCREARKELPHTVGVSEKGGVYASPTGVIPDWCPLEDEDEVLDVTAPSIVVQVEIRADGKVLWVNVDGKCRLRICRIPELQVIDNRSKKQ